MSIMETLNTRRTYRRFAQKPVPQDVVDDMVELSLIYISEPTRRYAISYAVFCLKKKK